MIEETHLEFGDAGLLRNNPHTALPFSQQHLSEIKHGLKRHCLSVQSQSNLFMRKYLQFSIAYNR